jgi:hypothetical protein
VLGPPVDIGDSTASTSASMGVSDGEKTAFTG